VKGYSTNIVNLINSSKEKRTFVIETFQDSRELEEIKTYLLKSIDQVIEKNWGKFSKDFISHHIIKANRLKIVRTDNEIVGIAAASLKKINNIDLLYLEFTTFHVKAQGFHLTVILNGAFIAEEYMRRLKSFILKPLNVITITRNIRVLGALTHFASYIYPDYREFERNGKLNPAPDNTWNLILKVLNNSWNPARKLLREGSVLVGSYEDAPWLILPKVQKHYNQALLAMGEKYLEFKSKSDKEFIVHAKFQLMSVIKYKIWQQSIIK